MMRAWYAESPQDICQTLQTSENGLRSDEAARRLAESGPNVLPEAKVDGYVVTFFRQFQSPLIYLLLAVSLSIAALGETVDAGIILAVLLFNSVVGTFQEGRAQNTLRALRQYVETTASVVRDGEEQVIADSEVVRGDVLILREGSKVPADARVIEASGLKTDEAALTGESEPIGKSVQTLGAGGKELSVAEQKNMVFKGTAVAVGSGRAVVVATGVNTVIGSIATAVSTIDSEIPLRADIRRLSRSIITVVGGISVVLFLLGLVRGEEIVAIFATVVSLAVSVIPEGLPIVITLVLATGVWRMSKRNALVKKLQAVEALGQAQVIAVDKTGTITKNELVVRELWTNDRAFVIDGIGYEPRGGVSIDGAVIDAANHPELLLAGKISALSATARVFFSEAEQRWLVAGDPTEASIRVFGEKIGFKKEDLTSEAPLVAEMPFDYRLKYHASVSREASGDSLVVSGAPESILALSTHIRRDGKNGPLHDADRKDLEAVLAQMSGRGLRVVALAVREPFAEELAVDTVKNLTFVAFLGMQDVLRPEVADAMVRAAAAGIKVVMITGDHELTARAIAKDAGIWNEGDAVLTGTLIDALSDDELKAEVGDVSVYARVTPEHKLRIITAYKNRGEIIAMTGDGVNDAPPLVAADLGVAMGKIGTEVAKEAADIILLDDNFGSIISAVEEGRSIYRTIKKVILYLFSTSLGEVLTLVGALVLDYPLPLLAAQIIWLNFVTDGFLDVALAMEPKEEGLLSGAFGKSKKRLVDGEMVRRMVVMALPMMVGTLFLFQTYAATDMAKAWTISLTTLAIFQWFNAWNCRSASVSFFRSGFFSNKYLIAATAMVVCLQMLAVYTPFLQGVLRTVPLSGSEWLLALVVATSVVVVEEVRKFFYRHHLRASSTSTPIPQIAS